MHGLASLQYHRPPQPLHVPACAAPRYYTEVDVALLKAGLADLSGEVDVLLTNEWPRGLATGVEGACFQGRRERGAAAHSRRRRGQPAWLRPSHPALAGVAAWERRQPSFSLVALPLPERAFSHTVPTPP